MNTNAVAAPEQSTETRSLKPHYRPDIDGMRAIAVVLVILYHLDASFAANGFVGVDIFFVISGFVVTRSTILSTPKDPWHAVALFWRRRILRILPAVLVTVATVSLLLVVFFPPFPYENYKANLRTGLSAIAGLGNLYLYRNSLDYFRADQSTNPFVHTWSLGVEEQFYFLYAVLFVGTLGFLRRHRLNICIALMALMGIISYATFLRMSASNPSMAYYFLPYRFWEIAAGSVLAYAEGCFPLCFAFLNSRLKTAIQVICIICIGIVVWASPATDFPVVQISVAVV